jgi:hypothetical protein
VEFMRLLHGAFFTLFFEPVHSRAYSSLALNSRTECVG